VISKTLAKIFQKLAKLVKFTPENNIYLVKNNTKVVRKKSLAPITTYLVSHGCIALCPKIANLFFKT
jgi:hypothetical protein